ALFDAENRDVLDFGNAIHWLFEQIEWIDEADTEAILSHWLAQSPASVDIRRDVVSQFRAAVRDRDVKALLAKPSKPTTLWREKRFELMLEDGSWVRGIFDRVVITSDNDGRPQHAAIIDYKSNRVSTDEQLHKTADGYRAQLELYSRALAALLGIGTHAITQQLLFTRLPRVYDLTP
ncbi:MAG: PD-(D/E)XK nuclease family protein, partial [Verrucomicrobia bacterium]|nr:PD-(D/E)XK nuclease family protein [Verrucomicrobiota bacterium]